MEPIQLAAPCHTKRPSRTARPTTPTLSTNTNRLPLDRLAMVMVAESGALATRSLAGPADFCLFVWLGGNGHDDQRRQNNGYATSERNHLRPSRAPSRRGMDLWLFPSPSACSPCGNRTQWLAPQPARTDRNSSRMRSHEIDPRHQGERSALIDRAFAAFSSNEACSEPQ